LDKDRIIIIQTSLRFLNLFSFTISENNSRTYELQMTMAINDNQEQSNIPDINAKLQEIMALAKEIEHLTKSKEN